MTTRVIHGDCLIELPMLPPASVQCVVTSPLYFNLRAYLPDGHPDKASEIAEPTPAEYVAALVGVFREVWRVLRDDGVVFLNLGDSYAGSRCGPQGALGEIAGRSIALQRMMRSADGNHVARTGAKPKDLLGIPWLVAFALRDDGWYLRSEVIWHKPNPLPESVIDRPTTAHEKVFLLTKRPTYFYDAEAIRETSEQPKRVRADRIGGKSRRERGQHSEGGIYTGSSTRNCRTVWTIATTPYSGSHFATMPPALAERCILAGTSERGCCPYCGAPWARIVEAESRPNWSGDGVRQKHDGTIYRQNIGGVGNDSRSKRFLGWEPTCPCPAHDPGPCTVLDCFGGAGTTGMVADRLGRNAILIELNPAYSSSAADRITSDAPLFAEVSA